jgi:TetR/AcrR family transcriptional regulator, transcriptional repressor for nem operon
MLDEGYAAVSYRTVAAMSGVTPWAVQYYFPTLDDLFLALLRARTEGNLNRLKAALQEHPDDVLRVIWEHSRDEVTAALMLEFMALGNHRKSIRAEITKVGERLREVWLEALPDQDSGYKFPPMEVPTPVLLFLLAGIPKLLLLEGAFDLAMGHAETVELVETSLEGAEPHRPARSRSGSSKSAGRQSRRP